MGDELFFGSVHFGLEEAQPLIEVILADWMLDFAVIFEGIFQVHFGTGILLFQVLDVAQCAFATGSSQPAPFQGEHFEGGLEVLSGFGILVPGELNAALEPNKIGDDHAHVLLDPQVDSILNILLAEAGLLDDEDIGDVVDYKQHDVFLL